MVAWAEALVPRSGHAERPSPTQSGCYSESIPAHLGAQSDTAGMRQAALVASAASKSAWQRLEAERPSAQALLLAVHGASEAVLGGGRPEGQAVLQTRFKNLDSILI